MKTLSAQLKALRKKQGWTQFDLAVKLQTNQVTIARWESGQHRPAKYYLRILTRRFKIEGTKP